MIIELFSFFGISSWGIDLDFCDIEWFALETNRDYSVIFEIAPNEWLSLPPVSKVKFPGSSQSLCRMPRLGNLLWVLELS